MPVPLVLVSDVIQTNPQYESDTQGDVAPRKDYVEIARQLQADLIGYNPAGQGWYRWARRLQRTFKLDLVESLSAVRRAAGYSVILSTSEKVAIPMAALLNVTRQNVPHVVIGHKLSSILKNRLFRTWQLHHTFSQVVCVSRSQVDYTINRLGVSPEKVAFVHDKVDHHFFHPLPQVNDGFILTVGKEQRDYRLLLRALSGTGIKLVVVASIPWSTSQAKMNQADDNVTV
ncbi:MAG: glycosyltransferase, partial [Anaerolineae bacterium]